MFFILSTLMIVTLFGMTPWCMTLTREMVLADVWERFTQCLILRYVGAGACSHIKAWFPGHVNTGKGNIKHSYVNNLLLLTHPIAKGLITLCFVSLVFYIFSRFHSRFWYQMLVSKTQEKSKTQAQRKKIFLYYTMHWVKKVSWLHFSRVLECLRLPKCKSNA